MKRREIIIGTLVAMLMVAGVLFSKLRHQPVAAGNGPELDISTANGGMVIDGITVEVAVEPRPARPFEKLRFLFRFSRNDAPVELKSARVSFNMTMDMGPHDFRLTRDGDQWIASDVVLPKCGSGSRLWFGALEFVDASTHHGRFRIDLAPVD